MHTTVVICVPGKQQSVEVPLMLTALPATSVYYKTRYQVVAAGVHFGEVEQEQPRRWNLYSAAEIPDPVRGDRKVHQLHFRYCSRHEAISDLIERNLEINPALVAALGF